MLTLLHSIYVPGSVSLLETWGDTGPVLSDHVACRDNAYPLGFQGYPSVLYVDSQGNKHVLNLPTSLEQIMNWKDGIETSLLPPSLDESKTSAISQVKAATIGIADYIWPRLKAEAVRLEVPPFDGLEAAQYAAFVQETLTIQYEAATAINACATHEELTALLADLQAMYGGEIGA